MTFLLDHDVPDAIARITQQAGHEVLRLRDVAPVETPDAQGIVNNINFA